MVARRSYRIVLRVDRTEVSLIVDDVRVGPVQTIDATLDDCGPAADDCKLFIGARSDADETAGAHALEGVVQAAVFYPGDALGKYPLHL